MQHFVTNDTTVKTPMPSMVPRFEKPPKFGRRLVPDVIDRAAHETPEREVFQIPYSEDPSDGWEKITFRTYANAINRSCHMIIKECGKAPEKKYPTIAYIGPNDARYVVLMVAAVKAGYKALFISPRNTLESQLNLFEATDCGVLAFPETHRTIVAPWLERRHMKALQIMSIEEMFSTTEVPHYPYNKTIEQAEWEPFVVLHTSGSTGFPKPVVCRQGAIAIGDAHHLLPDWEGYKPILRAWAENSERFFNPLPLFHAAGAYIFIYMTIYWNVPMVFGISQKQLSPELVAQCLSNINVESTVLPPSIIEEMSHVEKDIHLLARLKAVFFGGGSLAQGCGDRLTERGVTLQNIIAATETAPFPLYWNPNRELWQYFIYNTEQLGGEWRKFLADDEIYEQIIVRKDRSPGLQACFYTFAELESYPTNDLYQPHSEFPHHWRHVGRSDDIIVFSNGEKLNPATIEKTLEGDARIKSALVVGSGRFQPAVFIEPSSFPVSKQEQEQLVDNIWPVIVAANKDTVSHGQIDRTLVALSNPQKPFLRAGKGTVQRVGTSNLYKDEIRQIYDKLEQVTLSQLSHLDVSSEDALIRSIKAIFESHVGSANLEPDTDYFSAGIDSLQIIGASRLLRAGLEAIGFGAQAMMMNPQAINSHPTPRKLAHFVMQKIVLKESFTSAENETLQQQQDMTVLYKRYTADLQVVKKARSNAAEEGQTVILTGSTGMLGSYMLDIMARCPRVRRIICLNRAEDGGMKQQWKSANERALDKTFGGKAEFYRIDASLANLGLSKSLYTQLLTDVDRIVHNAWPVNFHMPVTSFEKNLQGIRNLADFAARAKKRVAVIFIASIATVLRWDAHKGPVPEGRLDNLSLADGGYGQSKMVGSLILEDASKAGDFPAASVRVGQIAGPDALHGVWNRHEWFPSIIASSLHLKALPTDLGRMTPIDWTPAERIARMVLEISGITQKVNPDTISAYYHGVNPSTTDWGLLATAVREFYGSARLPEMISFKEWVGRLENTPAVDENPGIKLIDTYRGMIHGDESVNHNVLVMSMERTMSQSPTMRNSKSITPELMKQWCHNWNF